MNRKLSRAVSAIAAAALMAVSMPVSAFSWLDNVPLFASDTADGGRLMYEDFNSKELGDYSSGVYVKTDAAADFIFEIIDGADVGKDDGKVLKLAKQPGITGDNTKEKVTIGDQWTWGDSAGHTVVTSFSAASACADPSGEQITFAVAGGDSGSNITGSYRMSKGKMGFGKNDGTKGPSDTDIKGSAYGTDWHKIVMVTAVNDANEAALTEYYLDGNKVEDMSCIPYDAKAKKPTKFRMNFNGDSPNTTTYVDDIAVIDINQELEYIDSVFEENIGIDTIVLNDSDTITLPLKYRGASIQWTSENNSIINVDNAVDGVAEVTHPETETTVKLTATLTYTGIAGYEVDGVALESQISHEFDFVVEQGGELSDEQKADRVAKNLSLEDTAAEDFYLPDEATNEDGSITGNVSWTSGDSAIVINGTQAIVTRPSYNKSDRTVNLTAVITVGEASVEKSFIVTVPKNEGPVGDNENIMYAAEYLSYMNFSEDTERVTGTDLYLPLSVSYNDAEIATIEWTSQNEALMNNTGDLLVEPTIEKKTLILTAKIMSGNAVEIKNYKIAIKQNSTAKAFPGAQGYGTQTRGGAGGYVYHVTSLGAEGPGTLKEALEEKKGARIIVFDVGGTIDLTPLGRALKMSGEDDSNVTIAGQTAPGEGIQLKGYGMTLSSVHDVIIRNISIRIGNVRKAGDTYQSDPLSVSGANRRVVLDHLSMCWAVDMGFRVYGQEITMSNCMISKGLYWNTPHEKGQHNYAGIFGPKYGSFYGNYIADCGQRAPRICDNEYIDIRNNVVFNSKYTFDICNYEWMGANTKYNVVNNVVLKGNMAPAGSTSNTTKGGSYKYFQGRTYSGGMITYTANNYDNTRAARPVDSSVSDIEGALWEGSLSADEESRVREELFAFSPTGYSNEASQWHNMILPENISLEEYDDSNVSKKGNTLVNYPFQVPTMKTYSAKDTAKYVLTNAGAKAPVRDILNSRYLAEGRTRLQVLSDYSKASKCYGIRLDSSYSGDTAYGLPVQTHTVYKDANGITVYDVNGQDVADSTGMTVVETYKFVSCENHLDTLYAVDTSGNKYRLELRDYTDEDDIYDAFELYDIDNNQLTKPSVYVSDSDSVDGMHFGNIVLKYADWGDGAGNYNHDTSTPTDPNVGTGVVDTEWTVDDWPQLPTVYRDGKFDSDDDGIPDFYVKMMGWDKHPQYKSGDISRLDFEGRGYTNIEYYINDYCAGDKELVEEIDNEPIKAENIRSGSPKYNTHRSHEILFNTARRAKAILYYNEGSDFDMSKAKELRLNRVYDYEGDYNRYLNADDFNTYFSAIITEDPSTGAAGLKPDTTYSYRIKTYSDSGIESMGTETYSFTTEPLSSGKPGTPRVTKYVPFDKQITISFEPYSVKDKTYKQNIFANPRNDDELKDDSKKHRLTMIGNNEYDIKADHYILRYATDKDFSDAKEVTIDAAATRYVLTGLSNDKQYYLDLKAVSADGTESDSAVFNQKQIEELEETDKDGNKLYRVRSIEVKGDSIEEYYAGNDVPFSTIEIQPTVYVVNEDYASALKEYDIQEGETTKFTTVYGDVKDWYIYTLGGEPIPTSYEGGSPILMLRDHTHDHGFTYAKKFSTLLDGKSTIRAKIMIKDEELDPMNQAPEFRFYIQQDSADMEDTDADVETTTENEATAFGNIVTLQFTKNEIIYNGGQSISKYSTDTWYDLKLLMDAETGTCSVYINDALVGKDMEYSDSATSNNIARWQLGSRLAGTQDVYIEYMYAYKGWEEPVSADSSATAKPDNTVGESTSGRRPSAGGGGGGGGGGTSAPKATSTPAPETTQTPDSVNPSDNNNNNDNINDSNNTEVKSGFKDMSGFEWAEEAVDTLNKKGIVYGMTEDTFAPEREITRAEFVTLLMRGFELIGEDAVCDFADVPDGSWYYPAVAMAYSMGVVNGYDGNTFGANDKVSRQDMASMISRLLSKLGFTMPEIRAYETFADDSDISEYAKDAVAELYKGGVINGVGERRFDPKSTANRAAAAQILYGTLKMYWNQEK